MKAIILTCDTGQGHNYAAKAISDILSTKNVSHEIVNTLKTFGSEKISNNISNIYTKTVFKSPKSFGMIYKLGSIVSKIKCKSPVYYANKLYANRLKRYIVENKFDTAICVHLFPAEALTYLRKKKKINIKFYAVATDYTCIPFWDEIEPDIFFSPHELLRNEFVQRGIPNEKIVCTGIPVMQKYTKKVNKETARHMLNIDKSVPTFLVMSGGVGSGQTIQLTKLLLEKNINLKIIAIAGKNETMLSELNKEFSTCDKVLVLGFTDKIDLYMDACDVVLTKAGGLTSTESAIKNIPIVHIAPIPGCETKNALFFSNNGISLWANNCEEAVEQALKIACNDNLAKEMMIKQKDIINKNSALDIYNCILKNEEV